MKLGVIMRYIFSMFFWVLVAKWCYSEVALSAPWALPVVDTALEIVEIPTHDKWSELSIVKSIQEKKIFTKILEHRETKALKRKISLEHLDTKTLNDFLSDI